jgi:putative transposase
MIKVGQFRLTNAGSFPNEEAAMKLLYLAVQNMSRKWSTVQGWREALNHFQILWPERMPALDRV